MSIEITIPHNFIPRDYQEALYNSVADGYKRAVACWHRRAGKDKTVLNIMIKEAFKRVGAYYYFLPTYSQGKKIIWNGMDRDGFAFLRHIPEEVRTNTLQNEMLVSLINGSIFQVIGSDNINCYDDKTEILTCNGWKLFKDLEAHEAVATLMDGELVYSYVNHRLKYDYTGEMYHIKSKAIDLLVTPGHKFWVESGKGIQKFKQIDDKTIEGYKIPSTCAYRGHVGRMALIQPLKTNEKPFLDEFFDLPKIQKICYVCGKGRHVEHDWNWNFPMKDWCAFMGIFLSEGSTFSDNRGNYRTLITQVPSSPVTKEIADLLDHMGLNYSYDNKSFAINNKQLWSYCRQFGHCHEKFIPRCLLSKSPLYLKILKDWLIKGDGSIQTGGNEIFFSTSKKLIDNFQELIIKLGYSGNITERPQGDAFIRGRKINSKKTLYQCIVRKSKFKYFKGPKGSYISKRPYSGKVYCVDAGSHVIKVRRNGYEAWSGNSIVGTNPVGCVFSEYSLQDPRGWDFVRPILRENGGWAIFIYTPRGHNHGYKLFKMAKGNSEWFCEHLTISDSGALTEADVQAERDAGMDEDLVQQEFFCSFEAAMPGAYYAQQMRAAKDEGRICDVPYDPILPVHTYWDLGIGDATVIWFIQMANNQYRCIDYYEQTGEPLSHYHQALNDKPYTYGSHVVPHDIEVRELGTGKSRREVAREMGIDFEVAPNLRVEDGIDAVRRILPQCWFDQTACDRGIDGLLSYHKDYDDKNQTFRLRPVHDWASHPADGFRYFAVTVGRQDYMFDPLDLSKCVAN